MLILAIVAFAVLATGTVISVQRKSRWTRSLWAGVFASALTTTYVWRGAPDAFIVGTVVGGLLVGILLVAKIPKKSFVMAGAFVAALALFMLGSVVGIDPSMSTATARISDPNDPRDYLDVTIVENPAGTVEEPLTGIDVNVGPNNTILYSAMCGYDPATKTYTVEDAESYSMIVECVTNRNLLSEESAQRWLESLALRSERAGLDANGRHRIPTWEEIQRYAELEKYGASFLTIVVQNKPESELSKDEARRRIAEAGYISTVNVYDLPVVYVTGGLLNSSSSNTGAIVDYGDQNKSIRVALGVPDVSIDTVITPKMATDLAINVQNVEDGYFIFVECMNITSGVFEPVVPVTPEKVKQPSKPVAKPETPVVTEKPNPTPTASPSPSPEPTSSPEPTPTPTPSPTPSPTPTPSPEPTPSPTPEPTPTPTPSPTPTEELIWVCRPTEGRIQILLSEKRETDLPDANDCKVAEDDRLEDLEDEIPPADGTTNDSEPEVIEDTVEDNPATVPSEQEGTVDNEVPELPADGSEEGTEDIQAHEDAPDVPSDAPTNSDGAPIGEDTNPDGSSAPAESTVSEQSAQDDAATEEAVVTESPEIGIPVEEETAGLTPLQQGSAGAGLAIGTAFVFGLLLGRSEREIKRVKLPV